MAASTPAKPARLNAKAQRCEPYTDGHWCFLYDGDHEATLRDLEAHDVLLGFASGKEADRRREEIGRQGLAVAWERPDDGGVIVDVLVGSTLTSGQKQKAEWMEPQQAFLTVTSGRLRVQTLESLSMGPDEPTEAGCEVDVPPGDYDVLLHRVNWALMDDDMEDRPEIPTEVLVLTPVKKKGPKRTTACLTLGEALGEDGAWLTAGRVEGGAFYGTTRSLAWQPGHVFVNLRGAHAQDLALALGDTLELTIQGTTIAAPFGGNLSPRGFAAYLGTELWERYAAAGSVRCSFSPYRGSTPWLLDLEGVDHPPDLEVTAKVGTPWYRWPGDLRGECAVERGRVTGRVVWVTPNSLILNFGWAELRGAKAVGSSILELTWPGGRRTVYLDSSDHDALNDLRRDLLTDPAAPGAASAPAPLLAKTMTHWHDPSLQPFWLQALVGEEHGLALAHGAEIELTVTGSL